MRRHTFAELLTGLTTGFTPVVDSGFSVTAYEKIDLSVRNQALTPEVLSTEAAFSQFLSDAVGNKLAWGGYDEERGLYDRSGLFSGPVVQDEKRNIHLGIDIWAKAGTPVLAALDGRIHSFQDNAGFGDYGPTIILEHHLGKERFYTLYGHLSRNSLEGLRVGAAVEKGDSLAALGEARENGEYTPHLHFQVIRNLWDHYGDFPGVTSRAERLKYLENCPDPNLLLKIR